MYIVESCCHRHRHPYLPLAHRLPLPRSDLTEVRERYHLLYFPPLHLQVVDKEADGALAARALRCNRVTRSSDRSGTIRPFINTTLPLTMDNFRFCHLPFH